MKLNKKIFSVFLIINAIVGTILGCLKNVAGPDALEAISWGDLISFGTNKHPPLSGWLMSGFYHLLGDNEIAIYILGQICILIGLFFVYKLAKYFLDEDKAMASAAILSISFYYPYQTFIDNFNCNIISICLWPILVYYFYKSTKENRLKNWAITGLVAGLSFLAKYQVMFLYLPLFLYLLICERKQFCKFGLYIAGIIAIIVIAPHWIWLYNTDFFSFNYIMARTTPDIGNTPISLVKFGHIIFPLKFWGDQLLALLPCFVVYLFLALKERNISININKENLSEKIFLLFVGLMPIFVLGAMGFLTGNRVVGNWGSTMVSFCGILLFYFFPIKFSENSFKYFMKWVFGVMFLWAIGICIFLLFQTKMVVGYPHQTIMPDFNRIWAEKTNNAKLKYVSGHPFYIFQFNVYNEQKPTIILETHGYPNPWISEDDVINNGVLVITETSEATENRVKELLPNTYQNYQIEPKKYTFKITNILKKSQDYDVYYEVIAPKQ